jgi:uncharacterized protein (TIGR03067 family)
MTPEDLAMLRAIGLCFGLVLALVPAARADDKADDWKGLKGTWKVEKAIFMGNESTDMFGTLILTIEEGKYAVDFRGQEEKGTIKLDPAKKPKQMTIQPTEGTNKEMTFLAIYELSGDTLKVCYDLGGKEAPAAFESKAGTLTLLITYKRDKK